MQITAFCPQCGYRLRMPSNMMAFLLGGFVLALIREATQDPECPLCGPIPKTQLAPHIQEQIRANTRRNVTILLAVVGTFAGAILLLILLGRG